MLSFTPEHVGRTFADLLITRAKKQSVSAIRDDLSEVLVILQNSNEPDDRDALREFVLRLADPIKVGAANVQ